ncbi:MAG: hypothetical protein AABZ47_07335 [Planctomycetota bacterium]
MFFRNRKRALTLPVVAILAGFLGFDQLQRWTQEKEQWQGTITRVYRRKPFLSRPNRSFRGYWEVRAEDGSTKDVRVYSRKLWNSGLPGHRTIKRAGQLDPDLFANR